MSVVVIDNGTGFMKAGYAGDSAPKFEFTSVVGKPRYVPVVAGLKYRNIYVGGIAQARRGVLSLSYPIRQGIVHDWDNLQIIWEHTFRHLLHTDSSDSTVIMTEAPKNPLRNREIMVEILFERFGCRGVFVGIQAVLALYTSGRTTGLVLDSGDGITHAVPVYEGYAIQHAITRIEYAGRTLTDFLGQLLTERGYYFTTTAETEIVRDIKEKLCFVSNHYTTDMKQCAKDEHYFNEDYILPDGQTITVGSERFRCPELLFRPSLLNLDGPGFQGHLFDTAMKCDIDIRADLLNNVMLSGGNTLFPGMASRLSDELQNRVPSTVNVFAPPDRKYAVWLGGSVLGSLSTFEDICVTKEEYEEYGPRVVHKKCF